MKVSLWIQLLVYLLAWLNPDALKASLLKRSPRELYRVKGGSHLYASEANEQVALPDDDIDPTIPEHVAFIGVSVHSTVSSFSPISHHA